MTEKNITKTIKMYMIKNQYTQLKLSEKTGLNPRTISGILSGTHSPKLETLIKILNVFDLKIEFDDKSRKRKEQYVYKSIGSINGNEIYERIVIN